MTHEPADAATAGIAVSPEVADALAEGRPVVALESTILAHGLPRPRNLEVGGQIEAAVRSAGAVPATVGVLGGRILVGLDAKALERLALGGEVAKLSVRDLPVAVARGLDGATTVASTAVIAARLGIAVFATGGLGGVHRAGRDGQSFDESADLVALARTPIAVVCAGVKSILDVGATLERLETLSVPVLGYRTSAFPGFYLSDSGHPVPWRAESPAEVADVLAAARALGTGAVVVANPLPADEQLDPGVHDEALASGLASAQRDGIAGKDVTPYLLAHFHRVTGGRSLDVNVRIILRNAELAARIAVAAATRR
ncbi:MAG: pseudouridylate synthase [Cryptosporangiaceae bacterium]|jgi:pseudouridine-5'-phosphate glycosidase|nr:pseudouridylate synthase [Cryptosporangiaceae bacterium]MDQ1658385.1 pseudouridylate synthase [Cryptosporangiaceae bacterium]